MESEAAYTDTYFVVFHYQKMVLWLVLILFFAALVYLVTRRMSGRGKQFARFSIGATLGGLLVMCGAVVAHHVIFVGDTPNVDAALLAARATMVGGGLALVGFAIGLGALLLAAIQRVRRP